MTAAPAAMAVLLTPAASAEFRYVPPETPVQAEAPSRSAAGSAAGHVPRAPGEAEPTDGRGVWRVNAGGTLRETLARWGARAGVDVLVLTDRRYRLHEARDFPGPFAGAVDAFFAALAHLPHPPAGALSADGRTLTVLHRVPQEGGER